MRDVLRWADEARQRALNGAFPSPNFSDKGKGKAAATNLAAESESRRRRDLALESAQYLDLDAAELGFMDPLEEDMGDEVCCIPPSACVLSAQTY
jgi:hypothetical protein